MDAQDTIVAISSAAGPAARMIVRLSGPRAMEMLSHATSREWPAGAHQTAILAPASLGSHPVPCTVYVFRAPNSYTGDDLVELHLPGNPLLTKHVIEDLIAHGARQAEPGEFTARAFLNARLDLTAAEGVAMTIAASNDAELSAARQLLAGELARRLVAPMEQLADTLALVEAGIDFTEEDIRFIDEPAIRARLGEVRRAIEKLMSESARFDRLTHEPRFALVGSPNAGKSTLLNALAGHERAVVSPVAGTTRDALSAKVAVDRGVVTLIDVAGLETVAHDPHGINAQMQARAQRALQEADFVLQLIDSSSAESPPVFDRQADLLVFNKIDVCPHASEPGTIAISAQRGDGMDELRHAISELAFGKSTSGASLALANRHVQALNEALAAIDRAESAVPTQAAEVIALEMRDALDALGRILGQITPDDVLGRIFGAFCIGK